MVINTNIQAQVSASNLATSSDMLAKSLSRLSSGSKIVNPADDAAGLAVASRLDAQVQRIAAARTQDGYLKKIAKALDRLSELAILAQDVTKGDADRALYQTEFSQLQAYVTNTSSKEFNGVSLFDGASLGVTIDSEGNTFSMTSPDLSDVEYDNALAGSTSIGTTTAAATALTHMRTAINKLAADRATIGAYQSRLNYTAEQLQVNKENLMAASSRIQDVDVAEESTNYARYNILVQAGTAMLTQANAMPQSALRLLQT